MSGVVKALADPSGKLIKRDRKGQSAFSGLYDPGGEILGEAGIGEARQIADPADLYTSEMSSFGGGPAVIDDSINIGELTPSIDTAYYSNISAQNRRRARTGGRASTMLYSGGSANIGTTTLLGG